MATTPLQWVEVRTSALRHNLRALQRHVTPAQVMPIIKGNAYGHGMQEVAQVLARERIWGFGVATIEDLQLLRQAKMATRTLVLSIVDPQLLTRQLVQGAVFVLADPQALSAFARAARRLRHTIDVHLKVDTGTSRIGILPKDVPFVVRALRRTPQVQVTGIFTHYADAENPRQAFTTEQHSRLMRSADVADRLLGRKLERHSACTAAAIMNPATHDDVIRLGIGQYGLWPSKGVARWAQRHAPSLQLQPVLSWRARMLQVKTVPAGTTIGYERTVRLRRRTRYGVLPVGYWDGYDRTLSKRGEVLVRGVRCPVLGNVCMNLTMIDLSRVPGARAGEVVTLLGRQGRGEVPAEELAEHGGTINYEVVTRIHPSTPRLLL